MYGKGIALVVSLVTDQRVQLVAAATLALVASLVLGAHEASAGLSTSPSRYHRP
jgi:hypothetical protein